MLDLLMRRARIFARNLRNVTTGHSFFSRVIAFALALMHVLSCVRENKLTCASTSALNTLRLHFRTQQPVAQLLLRHRRFSFSWLRLIQTGALMLSLPAMLTSPAFAKMHIATFSTAKTALVGGSVESATVSLEVTVDDPSVDGTGFATITMQGDAPCGGMPSGGTSWTASVTCSRTTTTLVNTYTATTYDGNDSRTITITVTPNFITLSVSPNGAVTGFPWPSIKVTGKLQAALPPGTSNIWHVNADGPLCCGYLLGVQGSDTGSFTIQTTASVSQPTDVHFTPVEPGSGTAMTLYANDNGNDRDLGGCSGAGAQHNGEGECGAPINTTNGNTYISATDVGYAGLGGGSRLSRTWNSKHPSADFALGWFGRSWMSTFDERLTFPQTNQVRYYRPDGSSVFFVYDTLNGVYRLNAPADAQLSLTYDSSTSTYSVWSLDNGRSTFNTTGKLQAVIDRNGNATTVQYLANGRIQTVTDPAGRKLTATYGNPSYAVITAITSDAGQTWTYTYDGIANLTQVHYPDNTNLNYNYNGSNLLLSVTDNEGKVLESHTYDSARKGLTSARAGGIESVTVSYPQFGMSTITDSQSHTTNIHYSYNGGHRVVIGTSGPGCSSCGSRGTESFQADSNGRRTSYTDELGHVTTYTYDTAGNLQSTTKTLNGQNLTWSYTYNSLGQVLTATDPLGNVTTNSYDTHGNLLTTTTPAPASGQSGSTTTFEYFANGLLKKITDPLNNVSNLTYTSTGLLQTIADAQNNVTTFEYDARGNRTAGVDAANNRTEFIYDAMNRLTKVTNPDLTYTQFAYDTRGRRTSVTDANGKITTYAYDDADRLKSVTDAANSVTAYAYDTENNLTSITDALSRVTSFQYDNKRRVTRTTFPSTLFEVYNYDNVGNLLSKVDRKNNTTTYYYDSLNRLYKKHYQDGSEVNFAYDNLSRLTQASDATGTYGLSYDNMGRLTGTTTQYAFLPGQTFTMSYGFDAASNRTSMTDPQNGVTSYVYDTLNRITSLSNPQSQQFTFAYDNLGRRTTLTRPNGVTTSYNYDSLSRLLSVLHEDSTNSVIDGATYTVDNVGNRMSKQNGLTGITESYSYDPLYELTQVASAGNITEWFSYDKVGNRTASHLSTSYAVNSSNELTADTTAAYQYDNNGNLISKTVGGNTTSYTWDYENRLTSVQLPNGGGTVRYKYDPFGRRIQKSAASGTTIYLYDRSDVNEELSSTGSVLTIYTNGVGVDEPLAISTGDVTNYVEQDGIGSVTSVSGSAGALTGANSYDSFGNAPTPNVRSFTGREWDQEIGTYYYRARYYDPNTGRFLSEDPIQFRGGSNFYEYAYNSPIRFIDPSGNQPALAAAPAASSAAPAAGTGLTVIQGGAGAAGAATLGSTFGAAIETGSPGGPIGVLVATNLALLAYDAKQTYDLGIAYGWWGDGKIPLKSQQTLNREGTEKAQRACGGGQNHDDDNDWCYREYLRLKNICAVLKSASCYSQAMEWYAACKAKKPLPPFPYSTIKVN